jgi:hypothetical protein
MKFNLEDSMRALVLVEPIQIPDLRKPTAMLSWPAWLVSQKNAATVNLQIHGTGFADVMTLPENLLPTQEQRTAIESHRANLLLCLYETPESDGRFAAETMTIITKMLLTLGGNKASADSTEAKAEAYEMALEDVPSWAVVAVQRRWYRSDCGKDEHGRPYDYRFMPDPASMRRLTISETFRVRNRVAELESILAAVPYIDCTEQLKRGRAAWDGLRMMANNPDALKNMTFEKAVELGSGAEGN